MLIRNRLLLLALVPVPVLLLLAAASLLGVQRQYVAALQVEDALQLIDRANAVNRAVLNLRDAESARASGQAQGLEALLFGGNPADAESVAPNSLEQPAANYLAFPLGELPESLRRAGQEVGTQIEQLRQRRVDDAASLEEAVAPYDRFLRTSGALPQVLAAASVSTAELDRGLQALALLQAVRDALARERLYVRHALVTNSLEPRLARAFIGSQGIFDLQLQLFNEVFADPQQREALAAPLVAARAAGREDLIRQLTSFSARQDRLSLLYDALGFGGLVYQYRVYVLQGDPQARGAAEAQARVASAMIDELLADVSLAAVERADLEAVGRSVAGYRDRLPRVAEMRARGLGPERIYNALRGDDGPALAALDRLASFRGGMEPAAWEALTAQLQADLDARVRETIDRLTDQTVSERRRRGVERAAVALAVTLTLSGLAWLAVLLFRRLSEGIRLLVDEFDRIATTGDVRPRRVVDGEDELARLNDSAVKIVQRLQATAEAADRLAAGDVGTILEPLGPDDRLAHAMAALTMSTRQFVAQAQAISAGDYATTVGPRGSRDALGVALTEMAAALRRFRDQAGQSQWLSSSHLEVLATMGNVDSAEILGERALAALGKLTGAPIGILYLLREGRLEAVAQMGTSGAVATVVGPGEGLVWRAFTSQGTRRLDVPPSHLRVHTGLGDSVPVSVTLTTVRARGSAVGVLELGWLGMLPDRVPTLLDVVSESLGLALIAAESRRRTETLLGETRMQAERLREQQEELRQTNEELEEQTQMLRQSEEELKAQREELQTTNEELQEKTNLLQRQREQLERTARDLARATQYKSEFLANMSHELRTPLNSLLILSRSLMENEQGNLDADQVQSARVIHEGGRDLLNLINDILDLSKVEAGKLDVHFKPFAIASLIDSLRRQFEPVARERSLSLVFQVAPGIPEEIVSDRQRVEQVLRNLLSNALKFTERGTVSLKVAPAAQRAAAGETDTALLAFSVEDTGIGIPEEKLDLIFQAFQQADGSTSRRYGGTGLGLTIARQMAALLGGAVRVSSQVGKGSCFSLVLPDQPAGALRTESTPAQMPPDEVPPFAGESEAPTDAALPLAEEPSPIEDDRDSLRPGERCMLVVEDDLKFAAIVRDVVRKRGYKCVVAADGGSALRLARSLQPAAVLLDMKLPDMDGKRVLERLKWSPSTRHIPVHVVSALEPSNEPLRQGAIGFLHKPAELSDLQQVVDRIEATLARGRRRVLVVEDDRNSQAALRALLGNPGTEVVAAGTAAVAMEKLRNEVFDCVVLDLTLPDSDGLSLLESLRADPAANHPPVVVYTGRELSGEEHRRLSELAQSVVVKGAASPDRLLDEVLLFLHAVESELPEAQRQAIGRIHGGADAFEGKKILIVDDDLRNVFALSGLLRKRGLEVVVADNGLMGLERLAQHPDVDAVLLDIMMPVMDGFETLKRIRQDERFRELPVIAVTAKAMAEDRRRCIEAGASDYVSKPVEFEALLAMLRVWLGRPS